MSKRDSVFSDVMKDKIKIEKLIFHIIINDDVQPIYLDEVVIDEEQEVFFTERFKDASKGTQYIFIDKDTSTTYANSKLIVENLDSNFIQSSKQLASDFKKLHTGTTSDGVFVVSLISIDEQKYIFLMKIDNKLVYQYKVEGSKAVLEKIKNTFIEDANAVQKKAIINFSNHFSWDVLAEDKYGGDDGLTIYFKSYLSVVEKEDAYSLTSKLLSCARVWGIENENELDVDDYSSDVRQRAINFINDNESFISKNFIDYLVNHSDEDKREALKKSLKEYMQDVGIYGQRFKINKRAIEGSKKKHVKLTAEGVKLEWFGNLNEKNIYISKEKDEEGRYKITINTSQIIDKSK